MTNTANSDGIHAHRSFIENYSAAEELNREQLETAWGELSAAYEEIKGIMPGLLRMKRPSFNLNRYVAENRRPVVSPTR